MQRIGVSLGLVDKPGGRRSHAIATPAVGGITILLAAAPIVIWLMPLTQQVRGLGFAAVVIAVAGVADDRFRVRWQYRLCAHITAALIIIYVGGIRVERLGDVFGPQLDTLGVFSVPVTIIATVGIINAVNMIDGVDGLAGTTSLATALMLAAAAAYAGNDHLAMGLAIFAGGLAGFLGFNLRTPWRRRARIFLGNAGSELIGLCLACASFRLTQNAAHPVGASLAPFLMAPAVIDCLTLMVRRTRNGASPFVGDRNHFHHLLLEAGATPTFVVLVLTIATLVIGGAAAIGIKAGLPPAVFSVAFVLLWVLYFAVTRQRKVVIERLSVVVRALGGRGGRLGGLDGLRPVVRGPENDYEGSE